MFNFIYNSMEDNVDNSMEKEKKTKSCELIELCIKNGANINATTPFGLTPLHFSISLVQIKYISLLLSLGADLSVTDKFGLFLFISIYIYLI